VSDPFFSVVIPTRNRPAYLGDAVASVLRQNFEDFECIVSDNFNDASTRNAVEDFADERLHYYRTDSLLNMMAHWEFATLKARGEFVILLADRKLLCQGALQRLRSELEEHPGTRAFSVGVAVFDERKGHMGWRPRQRRSGHYESAALIRDFLTVNVFGQESLDSVFPKTLNGGYHRSLAEDARKRTGHYFDNPGVTTPDYSSFFVNCALEQRVLHVGARLILTQGEADSNGRRFGTGDTAEYMKLLGRDDPYRGVPLKIPFIYNLLMVDYLAIQGLYGGNLATLAPDWEAFFRTLYAEYLMKTGAGASEARLGEWLSAWRAACEHGLGAGTATKIEKGARNPTSSAPAPLLEHVRDFINHRFSHWPAVNRVMRYRFASALEAAGFERPSASRGN
jgi:hypothetical protein